MGWAEADTALGVGAVHFLLLGLVIFAFSGRRGNEESTTDP